MLRVSGLVVRYGRMPAVQGIDLTVGEGEIVAVVGPNGAGKSSTLNAIAGAVPVAAGEVAFLGRRIDGRPPEAIARAGVALVPEGRRILATLTVRENLLLGRTANPDRRRADARIAEMLDRFPALGRTLARPAGTLSGGEQQQLALARALVAAPRLLLLDEPSAGLAPRLVDEVFASVAAIRADGGSVLLVDQNAARAVAVADRAHLLRAGRIARSGTGAQLGAGALAASGLGLG